MRPGFKSLPLLGLLVTSLSLANLYFAWTSHALDYLPSLKNEVTTVSNYLMSVSGTSTRFHESAVAFCASFQGNCSAPDVAVREFIDYEILALLGVAGVSAFMLYRRGGLGKAATRALQFVSLGVIPLGLEIYAFDRQEFGLHVSIVQETQNILPWFSNADLFCFSVSVFLLASLLGMSDTNSKRLRSVLQKLRASRLSNDYVAFACLGVLASVIAGVRLAQVELSGSTIWDSFAFLDNARILSMAQVSFPYDNTRPPVLSILISLIFQVTHPTMADGYIASALLFATAGIGCYLLSRQVMNQWLSVLCAVTFMTSPFVYLWAGISLTNVEGAGVASLALALFAMAATGRPRLYLLAMPVLVVAPFVRYTMALVLPLAIFYLIINRRSVRLRNRYFAFGMMLAVLTASILYEVWMSHLTAGGVGPLFPSPIVSNPTDYGAFVAAIPSASGDEAYGSVIVGLMLIGIGMLAFNALRKKPIDPLLLTLLLWSGSLLFYYSLFWPDKGPFDVTRYSTEYLMPLLILAFWTIGKGLGALGSVEAKIPWNKIAAVLLLFLISFVEVGGAETVYAGASGGNADSVLAVGMNQAASWIRTNVSPDSHLLLCTEYVLCWWYLPNYSITGSENLQVVESLAPSFSYIVYNTAQFGGPLTNITGITPVWNSTVGHYIVYKVGNGTALAQTYFPYSVQRGDTLLQIGQTFNVPWQEIAYANGLSAPYEIYPNQVLNVPQDNPACLNQGITLPADDAKANVTYGAPVYANETGVSPDKRVIIRFDDGYQDEWTNALPILAKYGYHAVFAIIDSYQKTQSVCTPYESFQQAYYMNWAEVQWLAQNGNEISDHTWTHPDLNTLSPAQLEQEIVYSKQVFIRHGIDPMTLTLPYGDGYGNATVMSYIISNGFSYVYTVEGVENTRQAIFPYSNVNVTWHDIDIFDNESLATFSSIANQAGPNNVVGLTFHSVGDDAVNDTYETNTANFAADMAYLHQNGFDVILPWQLPRINLTEGQ